MVRRESEDSLMGRRARIVRRNLQHRRAVKGFIEVTARRPYMADTLRRQIHASTRKEYRHAGR